MSIFNGDVKEMSHLVPGGGEEGGEPGEEPVPAAEVHRAVAGGHAGGQAVQDQQGARPAGRWYIISS